MYQIKNNLDAIKTFSDVYKSIAERLESLYIDIKDVETELADTTESVISNEGKLDKLNNRLQLLYNLFQKHNVDNIDELLKIQNELSEKLAKVTNATELLKEKEEQVISSKKKLFTIGKEISESRKKIVSPLEKDLAFILHDLGMPHAKFDISITQTEEFYHNGIDQIM